jgi:hypothetical protein
MAGGKPSWVEVELQCPNRINDNPAKGGTRSRTSITLSGKEALRVGKVYGPIAAERGTF